MNRLVNIEPKMASKIIFSRLISTIMAIPPMVLVIKIDFLLMGIELTKSTVLFLKIYPNKQMDKTTGMTYRPSILIIDKFSRLGMVLVPLSICIIKVIRLKMGTIPINKARIFLDFFRFCFR